MKGSGSGSKETIDELAAQLGIGDLEKFLRACIANTIMMAEAAGVGGNGQKFRYTVEEAAALVGVSPRWLVNQCRAGEVEHVHLARRRFFSHDQLLRLLEANAVKAPSCPADPVLARVLRRIEKG